MSSSATRNAAQGLSSQELGPEHYREICDEIGARLGFVLRPASDLPPRMIELLDKLALLDHDTPSIVPSMEDIAPVEEEAPLVRR